MCEKLYMKYKLLITFGVVSMCWSSQSHFKYMSVKKKRQHVRHLLDFNKESQTLEILIIPPAPYIILIYTLFPLKFNLHKDVKTIPF